MEPASMVVLSVVCTVALVCITVLCVALVWRDVELKCTALRVEEQGLRLVRARLELGRDNS